MEYAILQVEFGDIEYRCGSMVVSCYCSYCKSSLLKNLLFANRLQILHLLQALLCNRRVVSSIPSLEDNFDIREQRDVTCSEMESLLNGTSSIESSSASSSSLSSSSQFQESTISKPEFTSRIAVSKSGQHFLLVQFDILNLVPALN